MGPHRMVMWMWFDFCSRPVPPAQRGGGGAKEEEEREEEEREKEKDEEKGEKEEEAKVKRRQAGRDSRHSTLRLRTVRRGRLERCGVCVCVVCLEWNMLCCRVPCECCTRTTHIHTHTHFHLA